jgi:hypothetical protein
MDPKQRENGREREEARERDEEVPAVGKGGAKSLANKAAGAAAFEELETEPRPVPQRRSRGGTGVGRDLDH